MPLKFMQTNGCSVPIFAYFLLIGNDRLLEAVIQNQSTNLRNVPKADIRGSAIDELNGAWSSVNNCT